MIQNYYDNSFYCALYTFFTEYWRNTQENVFERSEAFLACPRENGESNPRLNTITHCPGLPRSQNAGACNNAAFGLITPTRIGEKCASIVRSFYLPLNKDVFKPEKAKNNLFLKKAKVSVKQSDKY